MFALKLHAWFALLPCIITARTPEQETLGIRNNVPLVEALGYGIDKFAEYLLETYHVPGISVAIVDLRLNEAVQIESKGYGISNFPSTPATGDTLYFTGSTTKAFTAAAAAKLVLRNDTALKWTSKMHDFLPEDFVLNNDYATTHTTLEDALSHRSGLPRHDLSYGPFNTSSIIKKLRGLPLTAEPRTRFQYCNLMFAAVSDLIERMTNTNLESVLKNWIWDPLGMQSTFFSVSDAAEASKDGSNRRLSRGYFWVEEPDAIQPGDHASQIEGEGPEGYFVPEPYINIAGLSGAGATISSVNDYAIWVQALLNAAGSENSKSNASSPISSSLWQEVVSSRTIVNFDGFPPFPPPSNRLLALPPTYALGWVNMPLVDHVCTNHGGGLTGFGTQVFLLPDEGFGVVTMGNTAETSNIVGTLLALRLMLTRLGEEDTGIVEMAAYIDQLNSFTGMTRPMRKGFCDGCDFLPNQGFGSTPTSSLCSNKNEQGRSAKTEKHLDVDLKRFAGVYKDPSYGVFMVTAGECTENMSLSSTDKQRRTEEWAENTEWPLDSDDRSPCLHILPLQRSWAFELELRPLSGDGSFDNFFSVQAWQPHGPHDADADLGTLPRCETSRSDVFSQTKAECRDRIVWTASPTLSFAHFETNFDGTVDRMGVGLEPEMIRAAKAAGGKDGQYEWRDALIWFSRE